MPGGASGGGTGSNLTKATVIVCGVASLVASLLSFLYDTSRLIGISMVTNTHISDLCVVDESRRKNYRKPLLQRYVIRILLMVPIYSASSWASIMSQDAAFYLDPLRDIYEAFTIYTFFQLLINFLGGERSLMIMMHGRQPVHHPWPLTHCLAKVDISDPHTFLAIKRGILQYAWLKPILGLATIVMKATGTYQEGYIGLTSGYLWSGILYNVSVTLSLYSLAMFWVCMSDDLQPFRPVPKFLCIKLIIFASYWQGFFLSILQFAGAIPSNVPGYTPDNLAAAIQDALICCEMPLFAVAHWYAFSWHDYADVTISAARMPVKYAMRDSFGVRDLIEDTKETFGGRQYEYRVFDSGDNVLAHEESESRAARMMEGMRYQRGGKGKYWIPKPGEINSRTPLLGGSAGPSRAATMSTSKRGRDLHEDTGSDEADEAKLDAEDERLFTTAKALEFGDWNYPVITAHVPAADRWLGADPDLITTSTNRNLLQPTKANRERRASNIQRDLAKGKSTRSRAPVLDAMLREDSSSSHSSRSGRSQLVDLVVEDTEAEQTERVRARKEGGSAWNEDEPKHYVRTYEDEDEGEVVREGFEPGRINPASGTDFGIGDDDDEPANVGKMHEDSEEARQWDTSNNQRPGDSSAGSHTYGTLDDRHVWETKDRDET